MTSRVALGAGLLALVLLAPVSAAAQIYKYKKPDGSIVYTDSLSELPKERRAHYNKLLAEQERKRRELERRIGKEKLRKQELERQRAELQKKKLAAAERARRMKAIDAALARLEEQRSARDSSKAQWQKRLKDAVDERNKLLELFRATQKKYNALATRASFTLLPGQRKEMDDLKKELDRLEKELDKAIREVQVVIPEEARKAGVPPGWLR